MENGSLLTLAIKSQGCTKILANPQANTNTLLSPDNYNKMLPGTTLISFLSDSLLDHDLFVKKSYILSPATQQAQK